MTSNPITDGTSHWLVAMPLLAALPNTHRLKLHGKSGLKTEPGQHAAAADGYARGYIAIAHAVYHERLLGDRLDHLPSSQALSALVAFCTGCITYLARYEQNSMFMFTDSVTP